MRRTPEPRSRGPAGPGVPRWAMAAAMMGFGVLIALFALYQGTTDTAPGVPTGPVDLGVQSTPARLPPRVTTTLRLRGAVTGTTTPVSLSLPSRDCAAGAASAGPVLTTIAFLDVNLGAAHHGVLAVAAQAAPSGTSATVHVTLTFDPVRREGSGALSVLPSGGGTLRFHVSPVPAGGADGDVDGELDWTCTG